MTTIPYYEALPTALVPSHYAVSIENIDSTANTFDGTVAITLGVNASTSELHLNYRDLSVNAERISAYLEGPDQSGSVAIESIEEFKSKEYFVIQFDRALPRNHTLKVEIRYSAIVQTNMAGFYRSDYLDEGIKKHMLSTQFEATDARRAFPCLDEPDRKATFDVSIEVQSHWTALANTPVELEKKGASGLTKWTFETTPIMSTYLLAWACGEFEYIESFTEKVLVKGKPIPVRIYTTKGLIEDARLALDVAPKIVDYFSDIFGIDYPLPKLDLLAVHSFSHGAMENWGLITYRTTALLYSQEKSDPSYKQRVVYVIAHELAHQWFGNLVTMKWWDELWLNEGFATWVGWLAVDHLYPQWDVFTAFVSDALQLALDLDGLRSSHPIEVPVKDALDIDQVFDAISYLKGASTINMLAQYVGTEKFLSGVALYLSRNKYSNATSHDLFDAISSTSDRPIDEWMDSWIKSVGFPVISVDASGKKLALEQHRFLNGGDVLPDEDTMRWWVPLNVVTSDLAALNLSIDSFLEKSVTIEDCKIPRGVFKINGGCLGVYRVAYTPSTLESHILPYLQALLPRDKVGLIADAAATGVAGVASTVTFLQLVTSIVKGDILGNDYSVWLELGKRLGSLANVFTDDTINTPQLIRNLLSAVYRSKAAELIADLESKGPVSDDFLFVKLRAEVLSRAGRLGIPVATEYAAKIFEAWCNGAAIDPSLRFFVFATVASRPEFNLSQFDAIMREVENPTALDSREVALLALGCTVNVEIATKLLGFLIYPSIIPTMDTHFLAGRLAANAQIRDMFWDFFKENYGALYDLMATNMVTFDRFVKVTLRNYQSMIKYAEIEHFFADKDCHGFERSLLQALDTIKTNAAWCARDGVAVAKFLQENAASYQQL